MWIGQRTLKNHTFYDIALIPHRVEYYMLHLARFPLEMHSTISLYIPSVINRKYSMSFFQQHHIPTEIRSRVLYGLWILLHIIQSVDQKGLLLNSSAKFSNHSFSLSCSPIAVFLLSSILLSYTILHSGSLSPAIIWHWNFLITFIMWLNVITASNSPPP